MAMNEPPHARSSRSLPHATPRCAGRRRGLGLIARISRLGDALWTSRSFQDRQAARSRFNANGWVFDVDRNLFSQELARLLEESLEGSGVDVAGGRSIEVQVDYIDFMFNGPCILDYRVVLDGERVFGMQSLGESSNFAYACRRALEAAVSDIVGDARTASLLRGE